MHVLVIGGAGYIGSHVVKELLKNDVKVTVFDDLSTGKEINLFPSAHFIKGTILDADALGRAMCQNVDAVIFLAGKKAVGESMQNPAKYANTNLIGVINVLNTMLECNVKKFIFSSSASVYGNPTYLPIDEKHPLNPMSFYGFTKLETERLLKWYDDLKGIRFVALRYFNAVGYDADGDVKGLEKNPQNLLPIIMEVALGKRPLLNIFGHDYDTPDGTCIRDYIHVTDLATGHWKALQYLNNGGASDYINLGTGKGLSVMEMLQKTEEVIGHKIRSVFDMRRAGDPSVVEASADKAEKVLGWKAEHSDLENIIRTTWAVYKKGYSQIS
ncbi:MAG: UDP-glucose 4-epimerase GalE [Alphaproteobacteria bacterium]|nr:UDP-glucose 4-epimerase GalE [Alphaproteobacteria bacterium]